MRFRVRNIIDAVVFNQELNRIEKQNEEYRREIQNLSSVESCQTIKETEKLLHYIESEDSVDSYDEEMFISFVDTIMVYSRNCIGFKLKCGLTLKEEICTDTR